MPTCPRCHYPLPHENALVCPSCGARLESTPSPWDTAKARIRGYFQTVYGIIFQPSRFFRSMPVSGGFTGPLAFALVTHWLGSAVEFLWRALMRGFTGGFSQKMLASRFEKLFQMAHLSDIHSPGNQGTSLLLQYQDRLSNWLWGAGSVLLDPFTTLFSAFVTAAFVFIGAKILVPAASLEGDLKNGAPRRVTFESSLRLICYGLTPSILSGVPLIGPFAAGLGTVIVTVIGAREIYRVGNGRAVAIALFPKILFFGVVALMVLFFAFLFFGLFTLVRA